MEEKEVRKHSMTWGWVLYRLVDGKVEFLGLYQTEEKAQADIDVLKPRGQEWKKASVPFLGWGYVAPGVFSQDGPPPLKVVE